MIWEEVERRAAGSMSPFHNPVCHLPSSIPRAQEPPPTNLNEIIPELICDIRGLKYHSVSPDLMPSSTRKEKESQQDDAVGKGTYHAGLVT